MKALKIVPFLAIVFLLLSTGCAENKPQTVVAEAKDYLNIKAVRVSAPGTDAAEPAVAAAPNKDVYVVWVEHGAEKNADVFLQKLNARNQTVGEKVRVNRDAGAATAWRGDPPTIAVGGDGKIFVGWTARVNAPESHGNNLMISVSSNGGRSFDPPIVINDDAQPASHGMHSLDVDKNGKIYVVWLDERYLNDPARLKRAEEPATTANHQTANSGAIAHEQSEPNAEVYFAASTNGGKSFSANKKLASDACPCCKTSVVADASGNVYAGWRQVLPDNFRHIAVAASSDNGASFNPATIVSDDRWQIAGCPVSGAALAIGANKVLDVVWFSAGEAGKPGIYRAESIDGGKTFSPRALVSEGAAFGTQVLLTDEAENLAAVWSANDKIIIGNLKNAAPVNELGTGELPSAARSGKNLVVAFIRKEKDTRAVWVAPAVSE